MTERKPLKILFLISSLRAGGAERVASTLCNHWVNNKQNVALVTIDSQDNDFYHTSDQITRYSINSYTPSRNGLEKVTAIMNRVARIRKIVTQHQPDVVVSFMDITNMLAIMACAFTQIPVIIAEHTYPPYYNDNNFFDFMRKNIYKLSAAFVTQTNIVAQWAEQFMGDKIVEVIANPLDNNSLAVELPPMRSNRIIAVGRLCHEKGFDLLIKVFHSCHDKYPDWNLIIVGEGVERKNLEQQLQELGLNERVKLAGQVESPQTYYADAKIFVLSSRVEGFPMVLLEAMAHNLAVVSFDCISGPADIIDNGVNGLLVPHRDVEQLALALQSLMQDAELRDRLSTEAIKVRDKYRLDVISEKWLDLMTRVKENI